MITEIIEHFSNCYPEEACGVITTKDVWIPCTNTSTNREFSFDPNEYLEILKNHQIKYIVHSHPDASPNPSIHDIVSCNSCQIPYLIYSFPSMESYMLHPEKVNKPLLGRTYTFGVSDCFEAARDYYKESGIELPPRDSFVEYWWTKGINYFSEENLNAWGFFKVDTFQEGDLLVFSVRSKVPNHCGVYVGDEIFYHHARDRLSRRENLQGFWHRYLTGVYRHATKSNT